MRAGYNVVNADLTGGCIVFERKIIREKRSGVIIIMKIEMTKLLNILSFSLDCVENEIIKTARNHGKRVAVLTNLMAKEAGYSQDVLYALTQSAVLHDCALAEYLKDELSRENKSLDETNMYEHCVAGEKMMSKLPFYHLVRGTVLFHHERADGKGALGLTEGMVPLYAQLIHTADAVDVKFSLDSMDREKFDAIRDWLNEERGSTISDKSADLFIKAIDFESLMSITGDHCREVVRIMIPELSDNLPIEALREVSSFFAKITDYKSNFTWRHSIGIAEKAESMGKYYHYDKEECDKLYIAGALHDIGKLLISNDILEKPGKLSNTEYKEIQNHAVGTWKLLSSVGGLEEISSWASLHHEKLDGSGYPFGYKADKLGKNERLLACLDIYQALVEQRPYKAGLSHNEAMAILYKMGASGQLDTDILNDINIRFAPDNETPIAAIPSDTTPEYHGETWQCPVCGYVYQGSLPDDFICPKCEQPGSIFERVHNS